MANCPRWAMPIFDQQKQKRIFHISMRRWYPLKSSMWLLNIIPKVRQVYQANIGQRSKEYYVIEKCNLVVSFHVRWSVYPQVPNSQFVVRFAGGRPMLKRVCTIRQRGFVSRAKVLYGIIPYSHPLVERAFSPGYCPFSMTVWHVDIYVWTNLFCSWWECANTH